MLQTNSVIGRRVVKDSVNFLFLFLLLEQKTVLSDNKDNDKVLTKAELRVGVDFLILSASATGSLSLDDYNEDENDMDYFTLREKMILKFIFFNLSKYSKCQFQIKVSRFQSFFLDLKPMLGPIS